jgi:16S rRNA processing protein RimM
MDETTFETRTVAVCRILHPHGTGGEMLVEPYLNDLGCYDRLGEVELRTVEGGSQSFRIARVRRAGDRLLVQFEEICTVETARALAGLECYVKREELPAPAEGEFYWFDLEGLTVYTESGDCLGQIEEFFPTGSNAVLVVRKGAQEILLPFIKDVVVAVDDAHGTMHVRAIPGLL